MEKFIPVVNKKICCKIWLKDILYIENDARIIHIVTTHGSYHEYAKISELYPYIGEDIRFFSCMKGFIINFDQVMAMKDQIIYFSNGMQYDLGRTNFLKTKQTFVNYMRKRPNGLLNETKSGSENAVNS